jgi:hypothetical protein
MASKKKNQKKSKKDAGRKAKPAKKQPQKLAIAKKLAKTVAPNKPVAKKRSSKKTTSGKTTRAANNRTRNKSQEQGSSAFSREMSKSRLGVQSGDLQGLSNRENVDSESVDELLEEGNPFEAGVVAGVEDSGERGVREVRTRRGAGR